MPIFEYKCAKCGKQFETLILSGQREEDIKCPECGGREIRKMISAPFLPSSVGKPANDSVPCCGNPEEMGCSPGSCCNKSNES